MANPNVQVWQYRHVLAVADWQLIPHADLKRIAARQAAHAIAERLIADNAMLIEVVEPDANRETLDFSRKAATLTFSVGVVRSKDEVARLAVQLNEERRKGWLDACEKIKDYARQFDTPGTRHARQTLQSAYDRLSAAPLTARGEASWRPMYLCPLNARDVEYLFGNGDTYDYPVLRLKPPELTLSVSEVFEDGAPMTLSKTFELEAVAWRLRR